MENKLSAYGYFTQEASYVFAFLASKAAGRVGLIGEMAETFGRGYSWARTGWFDPSGIENQHVIKQLFFMRMFFPLGGDFNWDFNSPVVKTKLSAVLHKFFAWQDNPRSYVQDVRDCYAALESFWRGLSLALDFSGGFPNQQFSKKSFSRSQKSVCLNISDQKESL